MKHLYIKIHVCVFALFGCIRVISHIVSLPIDFCVDTIGKPIEKVMCIFVIFTILGPTKEKLLNIEWFLIFNFFILFYFIF
jgi:hypothetical protein